ncbi:MAG: outer membrane lipoprotein carrier protein LolA, partial [Xanthomonadales bacterium]|nr:outer membrane lipoprotein carrier protein LolA [Xanthomonadales bacterium]NIX13303.1 outer membrane lipoprotein carrier protein LolA [Xanthomonadales bacterium]
TEAGTLEDMHLLELASMGQDSEFERVLLGLADDGIRIMAMEDAFGLRTEVRFSNVERNPELEDGLFRFEPPQNVDVVGDERTPGQQ